MRLERMLVLFLSIFLITSGLTANAQDSDTLAGTRWQLVTINADQVIGADYIAVALEFTDDSTLTGSAWCNSFNAAYSVSGGQMTVEPIARTEMSCAEDYQGPEDAFLQSLQAAAAIDLHVGTMTITDGNDIVLGFVPLDRPTVEDLPFVTRTAYYLADDEDGIQQVFQLVLDGAANESRQITHAASDVLSYGAAYDGLAVAYVSDGQLLLQPIHDGEPEALASLNAEHPFGRPSFSPDGQYLAYPDNGVWLMDLSTRETRLLLQDVPLADGASNAHEYRLYSPEQFVLSSDGQAAWLVVDVGIWEWNTAGLYDLATGEFQMIEDELYTDLLPLYGGQALIYGNNAINGEPVLRLAPDLTAIETYEVVLDFSGLIEEAVLFAEQAVEIAPGIVRVLGSMIGPALDFSGRPYFDFNLMERTVLAVNAVDLPLSETGAVDTGELSPDGTLLPVYLDMAWTETGSIAGQVVVVNLETGAEIVTLEDTVSAFHWQP